MVIYEVNLSINKDSFDSYLSWLTPHVKEMLNFKGFKKARYLNETKYDDHQTKNLTVQYEVDTMDDLEDYLTNHSSRMRDEGIKRFKDKFSASRRFFFIGDEF